MNAAQLPKSIGAVFPLTLRLWALPLIIAMLILADHFWVGMDSMQMTAIAAACIVLAGMPHGTLDVEIAADRFGRTSIAGKTKILFAYIACATAMILLWATAPEFALISFLIISIVHFSHDWRGSADPFLAMMVGWALVALPALARPTEVAMIFETLTGNQNGQLCWRARRYRLHLAAWSLRIGPMTMTTCKARLKSSRALSPPYSFRRLSLLRYFSAASIPRVISPMLCAKLKRFRRPKGQRSLLPFSLSQLVWVPCYLPTKAEAP